MLRFSKKKTPRNRPVKPRSLFGRLIPIGTVLALCGIAYLTWTLDLSFDVLTEEKDPFNYDGLVETISTQLTEELSRLRARTTASMGADVAAGNITTEPSQLLNSENWQVPHLLSARLIAPGVTRINDDQSPPLTFACFDLVYNAEEGKAPLPLEVHKFGSPDQHIDLVEPVKNQAGEIIGTLVASYNIAILQQKLNQHEVGNAYVELQQGTSALAAKGNAGMRVRALVKPQIKPIDNSRWQIALWVPSVTAVEVRQTVWQKLALVIGLIIVVFVVAGLLTRLENKRLAAMPDTADEPDKPATAEPVKEASTTQQSPATANTVAADVLFHGQDGLIVVDEGGASEEGSDMVETNTGVADASIFKAYDIRGIVDKALTVEVVKRIGQALGSEALARGEKLIVVARDGRSSGPRLMAALIEGLVSTGIKVMDVGMVPTPVLYFAAWKFAHGTGVMLTGSHNPPEYNGLKMVIGEQTLASEEIQNLRKRIESSDFVTGKGVTQKKDIIDAYIKRVTDDVMLLRRFKVVVDCGNGVAGVVAPKLLTALGCEVIELYSEVDGSFPNHHPDPSKPENLKDVIAKVAETGADLGMAFDGDGDRLGIITSEGKVVWPDRAMMLYAEDILKRNPGAEIIYDVKCSKHLADEIKKYGGKATMWNTGHSLIKAKMKETGALLAGEMSGHIFFKERWYGFDDATYTAARLLELLGPKSAGGPVLDVFNALPDSVNTPEINVKMEEGAHHAFINEFVKKARFEGATISTIDGLRADFENGWGLVRASNTTPVLVLRFEADSDIALANIMKKFKEQMLAVDAGLDLSF